MNDVRPARLENLRDFTRQAFCRAVIASTLAVEYIDKIGSLTNFVMNEDPC